MHVEDKGDSKAGGDRQEGEDARGEEEVDGAGETAGLTEDEITEGAGEAEITEGVGEAEITEGAGEAGSTEGAGEIEGTEGEGLMQRAGWLSSKSRNQRAAESMLKAFGKVREPEMMRSSTPQKKMSEVSSCWRLDQAESQRENLTSRSWRLPVRVRCRLQAGTVQILRLCLGIHEKVMTREEDRWSNG